MSLQLDIIYCMCAIIVGSVLSIYCIHTRSKNKRIYSEKSISIPKFDDGKGVGLKKKN